MSDHKGPRPRRLWWPIAAAIAVALALVWLLSGVDFDRLYDVVATAEAGYLVLLPLTAAAEQILRAWKWRQLLYAIRPVGTLRLFGTIMAGYFVGMLIPLGISPLVRSWLVARLEALKTSAVLATAAIDRLVDGVVFTLFVALALALAAFPDPGGGIRLGLFAGGAGSLVLFASLLLLLARYKRRAGSPDAWVTRLVALLPARFSAPVSRVSLSFAEGIVWPGETWRGAGIVLASVAIKIVALSYFLWAGLAFGVILAPADYIFLMTFLGFLIIITRLARVPGGFLLGSVFALDLLGVADEPALAMTLAVQLATMLTVAIVGALVLWWHGVTLDGLRAAADGKAENHER